MRYFYTFSLPAIILALTISTAVDADLSFSAFSFSSLFKSADCVVMGEVTGVKNSESAMHMTFDVKETLMGNAAGTITVSSPLYNGAFLEDQAYLGMDSPYVLFLKKSGNTWEVVNGTAGAMNGEYLADVRIIADEYKNNNALFSEAHISTQESVFTFLATKDAKRRLLEVMKGQFSDADAPFLSTLLLSGEPYLQEYAAQQAGNNKIYAVIHALANVCEQSSDHQVRSGCILALGKLESVAHISLIQKSLLSSFEREQIFAIIALGLIGDSSAIDSLVSVYDKATEDYIKSHIITALSRMKNSDDARSALVRILEEETDKTLITTAKSKIAGL